MTGRRTLRQKRNDFLRKQKKRIISVKDVSEVLLDQQSKAAEEADAQLQKRWREGRGRQLIG